MSTILLNKPFTIKPTATATTLRAVFRRKPTPRTGMAAARFSSTTTATSAPLHHHCKVGFIGLGNMGLPMAINLATKNKQNSVVAFDLNPDACTKAKDASCEIAKSIHDIGTLSVQQCPVIITMLPGCATVDSVMEILLTCSTTTTSNSIKDNKGGRVIVDCSTVSPTTSRKWHDAWQKHGHVMLDAPVSGGVKGATDGTLTFMVGCPDPMEDDNDNDNEYQKKNKAGLEKALPYLNSMGQRVMYCGKAGTGSATKLCNNLALAAQMAGICEAMNLGEALGVDPIVLANVMNTSTAKCWSSQVNNPHPKVAAAAAAASIGGGGGGGSPASNDYRGGFGTKLMLKDLGLATQVAKELRVALPITSLGKELYQLTDLRGFGDKDFGVLLQFLRGK
jgi:3-hydroxyisobutyrate dehydrogenase